MVEINPVQNNNIVKFQRQKQTFVPVFKAQGSDNSITRLPAVQPDFSVKSPISYQKLNDIMLPFDLKASVYKLSNGQRIVIVPKEGETVLKTYVNTGSMNEPDRVRGISHYIEHNLFNGSDGLEAGEFFKTVDKMGASTNASTGFAETNYYIKSHLLNNDDLEKKIRIHASMLETPRFAAEMLEKEKGIVNSEINMILSDPVNIGINKVLKNLYSIKTTSDDIIGGTTSNITNLTRDDVVDYYNQNYFPANMVTIVTGEVNPDETIKLISKYFTSKKQPPASRNYEELKPITKPVREDIISDKATATSIMLAFNGPANNNTKDKILIDALSQILTMSKNSRIDKALKKYNTSAVTDVEKISTKPNDGRAIIILTEGTEDASEKIIKTIYNQIAALEQNPPTDEELQILKKKMLNNFSSIFERSFGTNAVLGETFLDNDISGVINYENIINSITSKDLVEAAKKYLDLNRASLTVVHPASATPETIRANHRSAENISFTGSNVPKYAVNMSKVKEYKLDNNFAVVAQDINTNNACFDILYTTNKYPERIPAAADLLLSKLLNAGSKEKDEFIFQNDLDKSGIDTAFASGASDLKATSFFAAEDTKKAILAAKEVLLTPRFNEEVLNKCKSELRDEILTSEKHALDKLGPEIYKGLPNGASKQEILESIDKTSLNDIKNLYEFILKNGQANIVISAPFSKNPELKQEIFNIISEFPAVQPKNTNMKKVYSPIETSKVLTDVSNKPQAEIIQAYKFKCNQNLKDEVTLNLLNTILGGGPSSRLFNDLREQQKLAYAVRSGISFVDDIGTIALKIKTTTENKELGEISYDNLQKALEGFKKHIEKLKTEKVTEDELQNAKLSLKNSILGLNETNKGKNVTLEYGLISPYGLNQANLTLSLIDSITADDIYNAANYIFTQKPLYSILATENTLNKNKTYLDNLV